MSTEGAELRSESNTEHIKTGKSYGSVEDGENSCNADSGSSNVAPRGWRAELTAESIIAAVALFLVSFANQSTRFLPVYLVDFTGAAAPGTAINEDLAMSSVQYSLFATFCFAVPFFVMSLAIGHLADSFSRPVLLFIACLGWSLATAAMGLCSSFWSLCACRLSLGLTQAVSNPAVYSLVGDLFDESRALALGVVNLSVYVGAGTAAIGLNLDQLIGWRSCCLLFGCVSAVLSLTALTIREPRDGLQAPQEEQAESWLVRLQEVLEPRAVRWGMLASMLRFAAGLAIGAWLPEAMRVRFPTRIEQFGVDNSLIKALAGSFSSLVGGILADFMRARGCGHRGCMLLVAGTSLLAAPLWCLVLAGGCTFEFSMLMLLAEYLVAEMWFAPTLAVMLGVVRPDRRGSMQGIFAAMTTLGNLLPLLLGFAATDRLPAALQLTVGICYAASGLGFLASAWSL